LAKTREYRHYCPAARTLEVVGEKWSLLIVRDLLFGPQRFTDLLDSLGGITPKWLTLRLRDLETAGVVERDQVAGRREVRYGLTPKGRDLAPVMEALVGWGMEHARPPQPGDVIHPWRTIALAAFIFNQQGIRLPRAATWVIQLPQDEVHAITFDRERWFYQSGVVAGDLQIETTLPAWVTFLRASPSKRAEVLSDLRITGLPERIDELRTALITDPEPA
jgi:DNA-binding HxlR family transcriptional regulator